MCSSQPQFSELLSHQSRFQHTVKAFLLCKLGQQWPLGLYYINQIRFFSIQKLKINCIEPERLSWWKWESLLFLELALLELVTTAATVSAISWRSDLGRYCSSELHQILNWSGVFNTIKAHNQNRNLKIKLEIRWVKNFDITTDKHLQCKPLTCIHTATRNMNDVSVVEINWYLFNN